MENMREASSTSIASLNDELANFVTNFDEIQRNYVEKESKQKEEIRLEIEKKKIAKNYEILRLEKAIAKLKIQNDEKEKDNEKLKSSLSSTKDTLQKMIENKLFPNSTSKSRTSQAEAFENINIQDIGDSDDNLFQDFKLDDEQGNEVIESMGEFKMDTDSDPDVIILE